MDKIRLFLRLLASVLFSGPQMLTKADAYLAAWNERDVAAILKQTGNGSYQDPLTQEPVQGDALREHIVVLLTAFPDLQFELQGEITAGPHTVAARYRLLATHTGKLPGDIGFDAIEPTGRSLSLPGCLFFEFNADGYPVVHNSFDPQALGRQLGFQGFIVPQQMGDYSFGAFYRLNHGSMAAPGAIGLTWIRMEGGDEPFQHVATITRQALESLSESPGFVTGMVGARRPDENGESYGFTVSAWETLEAMDQIRPNPQHQSVVHEFMKEKVAHSTHSRVYQLVRTKPMMIACAECGKKNNAHNKSGVCSACKSPLGDAPPYW